MAGDLACACPEVRQQPAALKKLLGLGSVPMTVSYACQIDLRSFCGQATLVQVGEEQAESVLGDCRFSGLPSDLAESAIGPDSCLVSPLRPGGGAGGQ